MIAVFIWTLIDIVGLVFLGLVALSFLGIWVYCLLEKWYLRVKKWFNK